MYQQLNKPKENRNIAVANAVGRHKVIRGGVSKLIDNRDSGNEPIQMVQTFKMIGKGGIDYVHNSTKENNTQWIKYTKENDDERNAICGLAKRVLLKGKTGSKLDKGNPKTKWLRDNIKVSIKEVGKLWNTAIGMNKEWTTKGEQIRKANLLDVRKNILVLWRNVKADIGSLRTSIGGKPYQNMEEITEHEPMGKSYNTTDWPSPGVEIHPSVSMNDVRTMNKCAALTAGANKGGGSKCTWMDLPIFHTHHATTNKLIWVNRGDKTLIIGIVAHKHGGSNGATYGPMNGTSWAMGGGVMNLKEDKSHTHSVGFDEAWNAARVKRVKRDKTLGKNEK